MGLDSIKANKIHIASEGPMSNLYSETLAITEPYEYEKPPILRPSGFPGCSILTLLKMIEYKKRNHIIQEGSMHMSFFTGVGTTVHEVVQDWIGKTNKVLGDWQCVNAKCVRSKCRDESCKDKACTNHAHVTKAMQVGHLCKKCGSQMKYHELEVEYDRCTGHVDAILKVAKNAFWAGDYKTTSLKKLQEIVAPPVNYIYQISSYAWILKNVYDIPIVGFSIFYIVRDNPSLFKEFPYEFNKKAEREAKKIIDNEIKKHKAATKSFKTKDITFAIDAKPCKSLMQYEKLMSAYCNCPFVKVCFTENKLRKQLVESIRELESPEKQL